MPVQSASTTASPRQDRNYLLAALPTAEYIQVVADLDAVYLDSRQLLAMPDEPGKWVYFPRDAVVSLLVPMADGSAVEGATIGNEGMVGIEVFMGSGSGPMEAVTQIPGDAARVAASRFRQLAGRSLAFQALLQHYSLALMNQIARTSGCNRVHSVHDRVARVLLMSADRVERDTFPLTHELLALMLGVRRASVSQAVSVLQQAGLLDSHRGCMSILNRSGLLAAACEDYRLTREAYDELRDAR